jgi:two-component system LytT family response regulator
MSTAEMRAPTAWRPRVLIVEDEPLARRFLHRLLVRDGGVGEIRQCANGLEARAEIARWRPDIMFLDVEMPGLNGADLLGSLPADSAPVTIFTTAYSQHAIKAFELEACDYLLKPFDEARFEKALARAKASVEAARRRRGGARLPVQSGERTLLLDAGEVILVASEDNYVRVQVAGRFYLHRATLAAVERGLADQNFLRVHRRFLVNLAHVREIGAVAARRLHLTLSDGSVVPVSRGRRELIKARIAPS